MIIYMECTLNLFKQDESFFKFVSEGVPKETKNGIRYLVFNKPETTE